MKFKKLIRKTHRYLGIIIGIQFLFWTLSGLYFSWTNIDKIRGEHFKNSNYQSTVFNNLISPSELKDSLKIHSLELIEINRKPFYLVNNQKLFDATNGMYRNQITKSEVVSIVKNQLIPSLKIKNITELNQVGKHHEFRKKPLPVYVVEFEGKENLKAYVSKTNGKLLSVRHDGWRWFDFLWMTHTMDYEGRDDFNTFTLRAFSLFGLFTVISGFMLWFISSPALYKIKRKIE